MIDIKTLDEIIEYIEDTEVCIDGEWGSCRGVDELIEDQGMPDLYNRLIEIKTKI
jgi:hypothetical protein